MNRELDADRVLEDWLAEGPSRFPDHAIRATIDRLDDISQRKRWLPGSDRMHRLFLTATGLAAVLVAAVAFGSLNRDGPPAGEPTGATHISERHGYSIVLPDSTWTVEERPGVWSGLANFFDPNSGVGVDYFEELDADGNVVTFVYLASQPIPTGMTFDEWAAAHDASNERIVPCFVLDGALATNSIDGETARVGAWRCEDFEGGGAWTNVQTLVAHIGRGYAIYLWPAARGDEMPPVAELRAAADRWLDAFRFTDLTPPGETP
jgi:hypothetical protein